MQTGTNWTGNYSRFSFDESKRYFFGLKEQGKPLLDDELNLNQEIQITLLRRFIQDTFGNGSSNDGFKIIGTSAANDFTITGGDNTLDGAGHIYIDGWMVILPTDTTYSGQESPGPALTTPAALRTDEVYLDIYLDEVGPVEDATITDPTLGIATSRRLKLFWQVLVAEGSVTPLRYTDVNNRVHYTYKIATLNRIAQSAIDAAMVVDERRRFDLLFAKLNGDANQLFSVKDAVNTSEAVALGQADGRYAQLAVSNTFALEQISPKWTSTSARALKEPLELDLPGIDDLAKIGLYWFRWKGSPLVDIGTMADEVIGVLPSLASLGDDGTPVGVDYGKVAFVIARRLLDEVQQLRQQIEGRADDRREK